MISLRLCRVMLSLIGVLLAFISGLMALRGKFGDDVRLIVYSKMASEYHANLFVRPIQLMNERFGWQISAIPQGIFEDIGWYGNKFLWNTPIETYFSNWDGSNQQLVHDGDVMVGASPDKRLFSFAHWLDTEERYIYRFVRVEDHTTVDLDFPGQQPVLWLNDGHSFIYYTDYDMLVMDIDTHSSPTNLFHSPDIIQWVQLSPDKQSVYFVTADEDLSATFNHLSLASLLHTSLLEFDGYASIYDYSPTSQWLIIYTTTDSTNYRFYRISANSITPPLLLWEGSRPYHLTITDDWIVWNTWRTPSLTSQLFSISMTATKVNLISQSVGTFSLLKDELFFSIHAQTSSYLIRSQPDGSRQRVSAQNIGQFFIHEDSDWLVITHANFDYYRLRPDGSDEQFLVNLNGYGDCFTCQFSPDGRYFGYFTGDWQRDSRLVKFDLETGEKIIHQLPPIPAHEDLDDNSILSSYTWTSHQGFDQINIVLDGRYWRYPLRIDVESGVIYTSPSDRQGGLYGYMEEFTTLPITTLNIADEPHLVPFLGGLLLAGIALFSAKLI